MASDDIFAQLQLGITFDKKKWGKQMGIFDKPAAQQAPGTSQQTAAPPAAPPAAAAATGPPQAGEGRKKKKLRAVSEAAAAAAAGDEDGQQGGITLFGGQQGAAAAVAAAAVVASFVDHEPRVQTGDPFEEANVIRKAHKIKVSGTAPPAPLRSYAELEGKRGSCRRLLSNLATAGFLEPTPIQRQASTALLGARELLAIAPTGSGKTLAFLLPLVMLVRALKAAEREAAAAAAVSAEDAAVPAEDAALAEASKDEAAAEEDATEAAAAEEEGSEEEAGAAAEKGKKKGAMAPAAGGPGIKAIVVSPTKELSVQTARVLKLLLPGLRIRCSVLSKSTAAGTDFSKVDVLMAQPLRLGVMAEEGKVDLSSVRLLVLDEADKLFDMGFTEQIDTVIAACTHPDCVRALFSATLPEAVEGLARSVLKDPLRITVGERNTAVASVTQRLLFVGREEGKLLALRQLIGQGLRPPVLVFVATKDRAKELHRELMYDGVHVDSIHADQSQAARQAAVDNFRVGRTWVLVATDLIGRGMDFLGVNTVVNFDFPNSTTDYIHRVGRTGRAGRSGEAVTFFSEDDSGKLRSVANVMRSAGCEVPDWMLSLKKQRHHSYKRAAPEAGGISTEPAKAAKGGKKGGGGGGKKGGGGGKEGQQKQGGGGGKQQVGDRQPKQQQQQQKHKGRPAKKARQAE